MRFIGVLSIILLLSACDSKFDKMTSTEEALYNYEWDKSLLKDFTNKCLKGNKKFCKDIKLINKRVLDYEYSQFNKRKK